MSDIENSTILVGAGLEGAGQYLNQQAGIICGELDNLKNQLAPLGDSWAGQAAGDYQSCQELWNAAAYGLFGEDGTGGVLGYIAHTMGVVWGNYSDGEWANIQTWTQ
jgi:hypothetical protein